jgi:hypothetical protein
MDVKLQGVFTLPNETDKEASKGTQREISQTSFAHSFGEGTTSFQYLCEGERVKKFKERNKGRNS